VRGRDFFLLPLFTIVGAGATAWGGWSSYRAVMNWSPREVSCADVAKDRPSADWVRLVSCEPADGNIGYERGARVWRDGHEVPGPVRALYVPLHAPGTEGRVHVVLAIDSGPMLRSMDPAYPADDAADVTAKFFAGPLEGMIERMPDRSQTSRDDIKGLGLHLVDDFLVVDHDARPRPLWLAFGVLAIGLGADTYLARRWKRRRRRAEVPRATIVSG
jgi:hypothetical protein